MNRVYTEATDNLKKLFDDYKGVKYGKSDGADFFDNTDTKDVTGHLSAIAGSDDYYISKSYTEVSEQEFIDIIGFENLSADGVKESSGKLQYELDWSFIEQMAERMSSNKGKYPRNNWKKPIDIDSLKDGLSRHFIEVQKGNYEDDSRALGHLEAIACNVMMINYQINLQNKK